MSDLKLLSMPEQTAAHLRVELSRGRWCEAMPGRTELARQLGVGLTSAEAAFRVEDRRMD